MLIIEIILFFTGIYVIISGKIPAFLFGGTKFIIEGVGARILGFLLLLPIPLSFFAGMVIGFLFAEEGVVYAFISEVLILIGILIIVLIVARVIRKPSALSAPDDKAEETDIENQISKKATGSLIYALLGGLGVAAIVLCPLAYLRSGQAIRMIEEHGIGEKYKTRARMARIIAVFFFLVWAVMFGIIFYGAYMGMRM